MYDPSYWFWLADDERVYASAWQVLTTSADPDYVAWVSAGNVPTPWPRDDAGNQTDAALQEVLTPYNLWIDLYAYAAHVRYNHASGGLTINSISAVPFMTDPVSRNTVDSAHNYAVNNPGHITDWKLSNGSFIQLTEAQLATALQDIATFVQSCFTTESTTVASITGGTITTQAEIDAAFAAISNVIP
jgi:hypothetical protein